MTQRFISTLFLVLATLFTGCVFAQAPDFWGEMKEVNANRQPRQFLYDHANELMFSYNPVRYGMRSAMYFYQEKITYQIPSSCMYTPSCSEFSRQCFEQYGMVKAVFLSMDRLARCNRFEIALRSRYDLVTGKSGILFSDPPERYHFHK